MADKKELDTMSQMLLYQADPLAIITNLKMFAGFNIELNDLSSMLLRQAITKSIADKGDNDKIKQAIMFAAFSGGGAASGMNPMAAMAMGGGLGDLSKNPMLMMSLMGGKSGGLGDLSKNPMLMMSLMGGGGDMSKMLPFLLMQGGDSKSKDGGFDIGKLLMMQQFSGGNGGLGDLSKNPMLMMSLMGGGLFGGNKAAATPTSGGSTSSEPTTGAGTAY